MRTQRESPREISVSEHWRRIPSMADHTTNVPGRYPAAIRRSPGTCDLCARRPANSCATKRRDFLRLQDRDAGGRDSRKTRWTLPGEAIVATGAEELLNDLLSTRTDHASAASSISMSSCNSHMKRLGEGSVLWARVRAGCLPFLRHNTEAFPLATYQAIHSSRSCGKVRSAGQPRSGGRRRLPYPTARGG